MAGVNPASGTFSWGTFDEFFSNNIAQQLVIELGAPSDWMISRAAIGGAYIGTKGNMCPTTADTASGFANGLAAFANAVTQMATRAKTTWGRTGLVWELWNEINGPPSYADVQSYLGPYAKAVSQAILAVDPTAIVASPSVSIAENYSYLAAFLAASDGASGVAANWINAIAYHAYTSFTAGDPLRVYRGWNFIQGVQKAAGINLPVYVTEYGFYTPTGSPPDPTYLQDVPRELAILAACGARNVILYDFDSAMFGIDVVPGAVAAWNAALAIFTPGAVISALFIGPYWVEVIVNGIPYTF